MISERETAVLLRAGFTQREINTQRQKFYNLFRIEPYLNPMRKVGEWVDLTDEEIHDCFQQKNRDKVIERRLITRAIEAKIKERNT
jgi:hypothetical protein